MKTFEIRSNERNSVAVTVAGYERPISGEFYDDNWLQCEVSVHAGAFSGNFQASFLTSELETLGQALAELHRNLAGDYSFEPLEAQLLLRISCDKLGHLLIAGEAIDQPGVGQKLKFEFSMDQSYLTATLMQISDVMQTFPIRISR
jgi:hypothetical protein